MSLNFFQWRSLKTRVTLFTLAIFLISIWTLAFYASRILREDMQRLLSNQQFSTVSFMAAEANRALNNSLALLGKNSGLIDPELMHNPVALSEFVEQRPVLLNQFNGGVIVLGLDGLVLAEYPNSGRAGINYLGVDSVAAALKEGRSTVGAPIMDLQLQAPVFITAVPIRDTDGAVIGALAGMLDLSKTNALDPIIESHNGNTGYYLLEDPKSRLIITATGKRRIMEALPAPGVNAQIDRFVLGYDETGVTTDKRGVEVLASARRINIADWFLVSALPTDEAFARIDSLEQRTLLAAVFLTILAGGLTWWMLRRELSPMFVAMKTLATFSDTNLPPQVLPVASHDEIGELIEAFNHLLVTLGQRETALRESDERFRTLHDASFDGISIHDRGVILDCNQSLSDLSGYAVEELIGMNELKLIAPEWRDVAAKNIQSGEDQPVDIEGLCKNGTRYHLSIPGKSIPYKGRTVQVCEFRDITERKQMEEQVRQLALHDTLTKLPNRRLLNDRLNQTMAASKRSGCYGALMFLDLDNFKSLNDTQGHGVGDLLLIEVASRLKSCVREIDTVARFGGDEFIVMLNDLNADKSISMSQAESVAEKIRTLLSKPYLLTIKREEGADTKIEHHCTASIGVTLFINRDANQDEIIKRADSAMYEAKEAGRNSVRFYH